MLKSMQTCLRAWSNTVPPSISASTRQDKASLGGSDEVLYITVCLINTLCRFRWIILYNTCWNLWLIVEMLPETIVDVLYGPLIAAILEYFTTALFLVFYKLYIIVHNYVYYVPCLVLFRTPVHCLSTAFHFYMPCKKKDHLNCVCHVIREPPRCLDQVSREWAKCP